MSSQTSWDEDLSCLVQLATLYHQDFPELGLDANEVALDFISHLSTVEKTELGNQIEELIDRYPGADQTGLKNAWFYLGAQWWDREYDLNECLQSWAEDCE